MYDGDVEIAISRLRAELADCIDRVRAGDEIVVTDRGTPVARLVGVDTAARLDQLTREGVLSRPQRADRLDARSIQRVRARAPVSELVSEQRR